MTLDEALLYDAEWWLTPSMGMEYLTEEQSRIFYSYSNIGQELGNNEVMSWFNLLVREAIRND